MTTLNKMDKMRAALEAKEKKFDRNSSNREPNQYYPFWNLKENNQSLIRFLPDGNKDNDFFWAEKLVINLPFQGIKNEHNNEITVQVPCMEMYGKKDPILNQIRPWWNNEDMKPLASKYWKKKSYIFQGFVVDSGFTEDATPENPIRKFAINSSVFEIIKTSLMDPEMEDAPYDVNDGRDFKLVKTSQGQYASYTTSRWSVKPRALTAIERAALETYPLEDLRSNLPAEPSAEHLEAIMDMFTASVNDEAYDPDLWSQYYRPRGMRATETVSNLNTFRNTTTRAPVTPKAPEPVKTETQYHAPVEETPRAGGVPDANEILRRIRAQQNGQ